MSAEVEHTIDPHRHTTPALDFINASTSSPVPQHRNGDNNVDGPQKLGQNTPLSVNSNSLNAGFLLKNMDERNKRFAKEVRKYAIGTIPMDELLRRAFPNGASPQAVDDDTQVAGRSRNTRGKNKKNARNMKQRASGKSPTTTSRDHFKNVPISVSKEHELYKPLCDALNKLFPHHIVVDTHLHSEKLGGTLGSLIPDLCLYRKDILNQVLVIENQYIANFGLADIIIEVKKDPKSDPFIDAKANSVLGHVFIRDTKSYRDNISKALGQIAAYAAAVCARQHRTHCFTISIFGPIARIIRWDRAGAIVSRAFNYHDEAQWLTEFARHYSNATYAQQGYDMTVEKASAEEEIHFVEVVQEHVKEQLALSDNENMDEYMKAHYEKDNVFKVAVYPQEKVKADHASDDKEIDKPASDGEGDEDAAHSIPPSPEQSATSIGADSDDGSTTNDANNMLGPIEGDDGNPFLVNYENECVGAEAVQDPEPVQESPPSAVTGEEVPKEGSEQKPKCTSISEKYTSVQYFLVSKPVVAPASIAGRSTRGYWAVKLPDESLGETEYTIAFLKDTWRTSVPGSEKEGDIMVELIEDGVKNISDIFCHGDLTECSDADYAEYQATETDRLKKESWNCNKDWKNRVFAHTHYRVAFTEVGYPLSYLLGTKELMHATLTAFEAALDALKKSKRLHRDISINNIILVRKDDEIRVGILIDWELSCKSDRNGTARQYSRTGTWAFMSINVLQGGTGYRHTFQDDMESFFYVVLYAAIRWLPHDDVDELGKLMSGYFNEYDEIRGIPEGGNRKVANLWGRGKSFTKIFKWRNKHVERWIESCLLLQEKNDGIQLRWTEENVLKLWQDIDIKELPENDRVEHKIMLESEEIKDQEFQATSASVLSGWGSGNFVSSAHVASAIAGGSLVSLGKRSATDMEMEEGSEQSGMSRESKRKRPVKVVSVEVGSSEKRAGSSTGRRVVLRVEKRRERKAKN